MWFREFIRIAAKTSWRRVFNLLKLMASYHVSRMTGKLLHWGNPMSVSVEPTTACNLECPQCPSGLRSFTRPTGNLRFDDFKKFVSSSLKDVSLMTFYFQGEPLINGELLRMISYASSQGVYTVSSTNAHFLSREKCIEMVKSGLDRLVISVDGTTQEIYGQYRVKGNLEEVLNGVETLLSVRKQMKSSSPLVILQFIVFRHNEHQMEEMLKLSNRLGADRLEFKSAQIYDFEHGSPLIPEQALYSRYSESRDGGFEIKNSLLNHCWRMWSGTVITWDGRVVPCCFDKDASRIMGNAGTEDLLKIWKSSSYEIFRKQILRGRHEIDICRNCTEGLNA